jgi:hypothetical protein
MEANMGSEGTVAAPVSPLLQLCERAGVGDEAKALITPDIATKEFVSLLVEKEMLKDSLRLISHLLPRREAIGWGCLCVRHSLAGQQLPLPEVQMMAERWVSAPTEENRWAAKQGADAEEPKTASGFLGWAVFFAGPSIAPPNNPRPVPPPEKLTAVMVANAVVLTGIGKDPAKANDRYKVFMQKAMALVTRMQQATQS